MNLLKIYNEKKVFKNLEQIVKFLLVILMVMFGSLMNGWSEEGKQLNKKQRNEKSEKIFIEVPPEMKVPKLPGKFYKMFIKMKRPLVEIDKALMKENEYYHETLPIKFFIPEGFNELENRKRNIFKIVNNNLKSVFQVFDEKPVSLKVERIFSNLEGNKGNSFISLSTYRVHKNSSASLIKLLEAYYNQQLKYYNSVSVKSRAEVKSMNFLKKDGMVILQTITQPKKVRLTAYIWVIVLNNREVIRFDYVLTDLQKSTNPLKEISKVESFFGMINIISKNKF